MNAAHFALLDQNGKIHTLTDYKGKWLIVYFYPKDDTPGCTKEACSFRDAAEEFKKLGVTVFGISKDPVSSHSKFAGKHHLNFPLLADTSKDTIKAYGAWGQKKFMGREFEGTLRMTVVINPDGDIFKVYDQVNPLTHTAEVLRDLRSVLISE